MALVDLTIAPLIAHASTANHAWNILQTTYVNKSHSCIFSLRDTLTNLKKDSRSIDEYMKQIKSIIDDLASSVSLMSDEEIVIKVLSGLGSNYKELFVAIKARDNPISFEELYNKLLAHEMFIKHSEPKSAAPIITAQFHQKSHNSDSKNKNPITFNHRNLYDKNGHIAKVYRSRSHNAIEAQDNFATFMAYASSPSNNWIVDFDVSHHITNNSQSLQASTEFPSTDEIIVGDGKTIPITHIGHTTLSSPPNSLKLHVSFVEHIFPFKSNFSALARASSLNMDSWHYPLESPPLHSNSQANTDTLILLPTPSHLEQLAAQVTPEITSTSTIAADMPPKTSVSSASPSQSTNNIFKPKVIFDYLAVSSPKKLPFAPNTFYQAKKYLEWQAAMHDKFTALLKNNTWSLVPSSPSHNFVGCKWVYRIKHKPDGSIDRFKARLVAKGFYQCPGVDYHHTFGPVIKHTTIRLILTLAVSFKWPLRQLDVNNAFLKGTLNEVVYMQQPPGFVNLDFPQHVCELHKFIYVLHQAPRAWYNELKTFFLSCGFLRGKSDDSLS
ncbi:uncharacterized protein [Nicotiana sylvestris]|uniref:uncharacterized protein n=1 Tax=Nicotiana sylvestris TaxID=4096 RepID=UPI00388CCDBA